MKRYLKKGVYTALCLLLAIVLSGCPAPGVAENCATSQKGTAWQSEDGRVVFRVHDEPGQAVCPVFGTIETEDGCEEVAIFMTYLTSFVEVTPADDPSVLDPDIAREAAETWVYSKVCKDSFEITVKDGYYLETGEVITFRRVDDSETLSEQM